MVVYRDRWALPSAIHDRVDELLAPDEEVVLATANSGGFWGKWLDHYILTTQRVLELRKIFATESLSEVRLDAISQVEHTAKNRRICPVEVNGSGVHEEYRMLRDDGREFADALRGQLAEQTAAA